MENNWANPIELLKFCEALRLR